MQVIPLQAVPAQIFSVQLNGQNCDINLYQKSGGLFIDLYVDNVLVIGGVICQNLNRIVRYRYFNFIGDLAFADLQGSSNPDYTGLGERFILMYLEAADLVAA